MRRQKATARLGANSLAAVVPFCVMTVVACCDLLAGTQTGLLSLLSLGPALAPVALGPARTSTSSRSLRCRAMLAITAATVTPAIVAQATTARSEKPMPL